MRAFKIVLFLFIGLVLVAVAAVAALIFVDPSVYRNQLESRASAVFDRKFKIKGPIRLERSLRPRIILEDITIGNSDWASGAHFVTAEKVGLQVALFPLLRGDLRVLDVSFSGVNLYIEEGPDGANNYTFGNLGESDTPGVLPPIERLLVKDTVINYQTADGSSNRFEISQARLWNIPGEPERIEAQGATKGMAFIILLTADQDAELSGPQNPWSLKLDIEGPDMSLALSGRMDQAFEWERGDYRIKLSGNQADSLENLFDVEFPTAGPFELSANLNRDEGSFRVTDIAARVNGPPDTLAIKISHGEASGGQDEALHIALQGQFGEAPFALSFEGGPGAPEETSQTVWPLKLEASASGAILTGDGAVVTSENRKVLQLATRINGKRFESLGPLIGVSFPAIGKFNLSADVSSDGDVHAANNLKIQMGSNRLTGSVRWEDKTPRPFLTGKLSSERLTLKKFFKSPSKPPSKNRPAGMLDRPIKLDGLKEFDARLDLSVKRLADSPISVADVRSTVTLTNGELSAPFRASLAGAPVDGQIQLRQPKNIPVVSLKTTIGRVDVGQALKQLKIPDIVAGTADAVNVDCSSSGKTLRALGEQAAITLQIKPANLIYTAEIADQTVDIQIESAKLVARKDQPLTGTFSGTVRGAAFNAEVSTANLREIRKADIPLPVRVALQTADLQLKAEGVIARPIENYEFELQHELAGKEIEELDPLFDFAVPLRGAFRAQGRITARGNRFTFEEDLRVGKSDLKAEITVLRDPPRPKITGRIFASQIHLDDIDLFDVDKQTAPTQDKTRVIPDYTVPVDVLTAADLDLDIKIERIDAGLGDLGDFGDLVSKINLKDGRFKSTTHVTGFTGARLSSEFELNAAADPPMNKIQITAKDLDYGLLFKQMGVTDLLEGRINLYVNLSGPGAARRRFLENADGRITVVGGPGKISSRLVDLWAADLITTMLSPRWQTQAVTEMNCFVTHIELKEGQAEIDDILLDTGRITIAGSGLLDLETEALKVLIAPRPKRASLVSLANPVRIEGTLAAPEVSVTRLPRGRRLAGTGFSLFAGLLNPAFLIFTFSDTGTGKANPCDAAIERAYEAIEVGSQ